MSATGSSADIVERIKRLIPGRWFSWVAPNRDAILGGLSDLAAWGYNLISYARAQSRIATAYGVWLDIIGFDFLQRFITRGSMGDDAFRAFIKATILKERVTRTGMINGVTTLTGNAPWVFEPWNTYDTAAYSRTVNQYTLSPTAAAYVSVVSDNFIVNGLTAKFGGVAQSVASYAAIGWSVIAARPTATGYQLLWRNSAWSANLPTIAPGGYTTVYLIWTCDSTCNFVYQGVNNAPPDLYSTVTSLADPDVDPSFRVVTQIRPPGCPMMGYGVGVGGYGNMKLPGQAFMTVTRSTPSGIPSVGGYSNNIAGWGLGAIEYAGSWLALVGVTNALIYKLINLTKPTGSLMWVAIGAPARGVPKRMAIMNLKTNSQYIAVI